ncbi:MAG: hypothetical protein V3T59_02635 [Desulfobacterales bacterium]
MKFKRIYDMRLNRTGLVFGETSKTLIVGWATEVDKNARFKGKKRYKYKGGYNAFIDNGLS